MTSLRSRGPVAAAAFGLAAFCAGCGTTYVDTAITQPPGEAAEAEPEPITTLDPTDTTLDELLIEIERLMVGLDRRVVDDDRADEVLAAIDEFWDEADRRIRSDDPDELFNFQQAVELARSGVERRRPADASKGYKLFVDVSDAYRNR